jgi:uncharacterized protein YndB with AHSA1/START domain
MFEAEASRSTQTPASAVWARWISPARWPEWDPRVKSAEAESDLEVGVPIKVRLGKGGSVRQEVVELDPGHRLVTEYKLPGARVGHEHLVEQRGPGSEVTHRLYVDGPLGGVWAMMLSRKKLRDAVANFTDTIKPG